MAADHVLPRRCAQPIKHVYYACDFGINGLGSLALAFAWPPQRAYHPELAQLTRQREKVFAGLDLPGSSAPTSGTEGREGGQGYAPGPASQGPYACC